MISKEKFEGGSDMGATADLIVIVLYMLAILGVGFYASRKVKGTEDYTIAALAAVIVRFFAQNLQ